MHIRPIKTKKTEFKLNLGDKYVKLCNEYKYLGVTINELLNFNKMAQHFYDSASRALGAIIYKIKKFGGFP
jgi:hypothetical protein